MTNLNTAILIVFMGELKKYYTRQQAYFAEFRSLERSTDMSDFSSFAFTECSTSLTAGRGSVVGNDADFREGRVALIGAEFFIPCLLAKAAFYTGVLIWTPGILI